MDFLIVPAAFSAIIGGGARLQLAIDHHMRRREQTKSK